MTLRWSEVKATGRCPPEEECYIQKWETWILDEDMKVATLTIDGSLIWDTSKDDLKISTKYVMVFGAGTFELGTTDSPMELKATVYIETPWDNWDPKDNSVDSDTIGHYNGAFGSRFLGGMPGSTIRIHGRKMERTWTLLSADAQSGSTTLRY